MLAPFKTIGIFGRVTNPGVLETLRQLIEFLENLNQPMIVETETYAALNAPKLAFCPAEDLSKHCNLLIVVGGDGSLLRAAHRIIKNQTPVLGINRGRLGFLTDILPTELDKIKNILAGDYILETRFLLSARVEYQGNILGESDALNEVALIPDSVPHMNEFEIYINDHFVCSQNSDGFIIATPTGSTAYALSGGGPILHPSLDAIVIVPMFPHSLSMRPIVIDANQRVSILISPKNISTPRITCDSQEPIAAPPGSVIQICKKVQQLHLIHPVDYDYYATLGSKLHWGRKLHLID